ncbi:G protein alpha-like subunit [Dothistroma septosporum NZE10]|uniref:Guanine nucleotide-binding protein alpha-2 subunit n=1 Tax=Dothistroma septosporum (strain NZE10 / CBS 128990) TaxID=675120 RepID=N1Q4A3_DOTSN|nr:G protein alpha-like subunit [Dothistroma septosporum NZE10]
MAIMCFGSGNKEDPEAKKSKEIEKQLREDQKRMAKEVKLLLLGAGESGKSTVLKQMRLIHTKGFSTQERKQWKVTIFQNLLHAFQVVFGAMEEQEVDFADNDNIRFAEIVAADPDIGADEAMPLDCLNAFRSLWEDQGVQAAIKKGNEYALHDNLTYYFSDIERLFAKDYLPTDQDILRARLRTTGISETIFETGNLTYRMFDVGGQRSERKKWIHVFDNVQVVLFLVAISGFDHVLVEDRNGNQMHEALMLFESIANSKYFEKSALILFLNKIDLFNEKVETGAARIVDHFPDYMGSERDTEAGAQFFARKFRNLVRDPDKDAYVHFTNATDTNLLDKTMKSVQDMIVQRNLHNLML